VWIQEVVLVLYLLIFFNRNFIVQFSYIKTINREWAISKVYILIFYLVKVRFKKYQFEPIIKGEKYE
ncbi:hypothetical protein, partial [Enterococcus faecalis]|uniref:hypothetical protein n=1 Tax=Enterococcus faecalis TaxID=1351 RepID=UPI001C4FD123